MFMGKGTAKNRVHFRLGCHPSLIKNKRSNRAKVALIENALNVRCKASADTL
jgi:hypothetical protein